MADGRYSSLEKAYQSYREKTADLLAKKDAHILRLQTRLEAMESKLEGHEQVHIYPAIDPSPGSVFLTLKLPEFGALSLEFPTSQSHQYPSPLLSPYVPHRLLLPHLRFIFLPPHSGVPKSTALVRLSWPVAGTAFHSPPTQFSGLPPPPDPAP